MICVTLLRQFRDRLGCLLDALGGQLQRQIRYRQGLRYSVTCVQVAKIEQQNSLELRSETRIQSDESLGREVPG